MTVVVKRLFSQVDFQTMPLCGWYSKVECHHFARKSFLSVALMNNVLITRKIRVYCGFKFVYLTLKTHYNSKNISCHFSAFVDNFKMIYPRRLNILNK